MNGFEPQIRELEARFSELTPSERERLRQLRQRQARLEMRVASAEAARRHRQQEQARRRLEIERSVRASAIEELQALQRDGVEP